MADRTGQQIEEYRLTRLLGSGTYGTVYQAAHEAQDWDVYQAEPDAGKQSSTRPVAIKVFQQELSPELQEHFSKEAHALQVQHPRILRTIASGLAGNTPYIVMELVEEGNIRQRHPLGTRVSLTQVVQYVQQIADGLQSIHERGLLHRNLKPQNILLRGPNDLVVSDCSIGVVLHAAGDLTRFELAESVPYAAPELFQGRPQPASDQYALAVMVYEWLCGVRPFTGSQESIISQHQTAQPAALRLYVPDIAGSVEAVILRALAKDPQVRYANVREFAQALTQAVQFQTAPTGFAQGTSSTYIPYTPANSPTGSTDYPSAAVGRGIQNKPVSNLLSMAGGFSLMVGAGLSMLGTILVVFPRPPILVGNLLDIIGMFLIAFGLIVFARLLTDRARVLALASVIVFSTALIGYSVIHAYSPWYFERLGQYVVSEEETLQVIYTLFAVLAGCTILFFCGLIIFAVSILHAGNRLPRWRSIAAYGLIGAGGFLIILRILTLPGIPDWLNFNDPIATLLTNFSHVLYFTSQLIIVCVGFALLTHVTNEQGPNVGEGVTVQQVQKV